MAQGRAFMSSPVHYLCKKFNKNFETEAPYNHQSLQAEYGIKSLSTIMTKPFKF